MFVSTFYDPIVRCRSRRDQCALVMEMDLGQTQCDASQTGHSIIPVYHFYIQYLQ